jgi:aquaporin related protein
MNINEPSDGRGFVMPFANYKRARRAGSRPESVKSNRIPFLNWVPDDVKKAWDWF